MPRADARSPWNRNGAEPGDKRPKRSYPKSDQYVPKNLQRRLYFEGAEWSPGQPTINKGAGHFHRPGSQNPRKG